MQYENFFFDNKHEVEGILNHGSPEEKVGAIIGAINGVDDSEWLQEICLRYCHDSDFWVSKAAINGLGDIARLHRSLDKNRVVSVLGSIKDQRLLPIVRQTIQDITFFMP